jgi:hypothetical protein
MTTPPFADNDVDDGRELGAEIGAKPATPDSARAERQKLKISIIILLLLLELLYNTCCLLIDCVA